MQDRHGAIAGVFDDLTLLHEDWSGAIVMTVPWNNAAGLYCQLTKAQFTILQVSWLLFKIDRAQGDIADADGFEIDFVARIGLHLVRGAFACECRTGKGRSGSGAGQGEAEPECACS